MVGYRMQKNLTECKEDVKEWNEKKQCKGTVKNTSRM